MLGRRHIWPIFCAAVAITYDMICYDMIWQCWLTSLIFWWNLCHMQKNRQTTKTNQNLWCTFLFFAILWVFRKKITNWNNFREVYKIQHDTMFKKLLTKNPLAWKKIKNCISFLMIKILQILKDFAWSFHQS